MSGRVSEYVESKKTEVASANNAASAGTNTDKGITTAEFLGGSIVVGTIVAAGILASRGKAAEVLSRITSKAVSTLETQGTLPRTLITGLERSEALLPSARPATYGEILTEKSVSFTAETARKFASLIKKPAESLDGEVKAIDDQTRTFVFNRFLQRFDNNDTVVWGSYSAESLVPGARKATHDLDLIVTPPQGTKGMAANNAAFDKIKELATADKGDGMQFEVERIGNPLITKFFPNILHAHAVAKSNGRELMRFELDARLEPRTVLPPITRMLDSIGDAASRPVALMQPEEGFAHKFYSYTTRNFGGLDRKPKDVLDMATMLKSGIDETLVRNALQEWTSRGYELGRFRTPSEIMGNRLERNMAGQTPAQLDENVGIIRNFYDRIQPQLANIELLPGVKTDPLSRLTRLARRQVLIFPVQ